MTLLFSLLFAITANANTKVEPHELFTNFDVASATPDKGFQIEPTANRYAEVISRDGKRRTLRLKVQPGSSKTEISVTYQIEDDGKTFVLAKSIFQCLECNLSISDTNMFTPQHWESYSKNEWEDFNNGKYKVIQSLVDNCSPYAIRGEVYDVFSSVSSNAYACSFKDRTLVFNTPKDTEKCGNYFCTINFFIDSYVGQRTPRNVTFDNKGSRPMIPIYDPASKKTRIYYYDTDKTKSDNYYSDNYYEFQPKPVVKGEISAEFEFIDYETGELIAITADRKIAWTEEPVPFGNNDFPAVSFSSDSITPHAYKNVFFGNAKYYEGVEISAGLFFPTRDPSDRLVTARYIFHGNINFPRILFLEFGMLNNKDYVGYTINRDTKKITSSYNAKYRNTFLALNAKTLSNQTETLFWSLNLGAPGEILFTDLITGKTIVQGNTSACTTLPEGSINFGTYSISVPTNELIWTGPGKNSTDLCELRMPISLN